MIQLIYTSAALKLMDDEELDSILLDARAGNAKAGVTGMLLYAEGTFFQVLEGDGPVVRALFERISADTRHRGVIKLVEREISERTFSEWSMGFRRYDKLSDLPPAFFDLSARKLNDAVPAKASIEVVALLKAFAQTSLRNAV